MASDSPEARQLSDFSHNPQAALAQARRRLSMRQQQGPGMSHRDFIPDPHGALIEEHNRVHLGVKSRRIKETAGSDSDAENDEQDIFLPSTLKEAKKMITPFLTRHIPSQYNPLGKPGQPTPATATSTSSTKYCYRHRPDLKCRRQADEPSMDQLQSELGTLSQADQQAISHVWSLFSAAPSKHRQLMLQGVLAQCCFPQLSFISASVKSLIKIDFLSALPPELGYKILCYLDTASLCRAAQVSQRWRAMADDDVVWHRMCEQHIDRKCTKCGWGLPLLEAKRLRAEKRLVQLRAAGRSLHGESSDSAQLPASHEAPGSPGFEAPDASQDSDTRPGSKRPMADSLSPAEPAAKRKCTDAVLSDATSVDSRLKRPWKDVYKDRFKVGTNWKYGRCSMKVFKGHTNGVMCLQFDDTILATGSYDTTIKIWDIESGEEIRTLSGHTAGIRCLQFDETRLFSGSNDRTLKVWNWRTGECIKTFTGPTGGIIGLHYSDKILACGSTDHTVRVWNLQDKSTFLLRGHTDWVNAVKIDSNSRTLFSASDDCTIRLWDLDTRQCIKIFRGHVGQVQQVLLLPEEFELNEEDDSLLAQPSSMDSDRDYSDVGGMLPDAASPYGNYSSTSPLPGSPGRHDKPAPPKFMLTGALDGTIRLWHIPTGRCVRTFFGHVEGVWALAADTLRIVSGAEDRMVKLWDPRTGACERTFVGHAAPVTCLGLSDSRFATGSEDCEVRLYSFVGEDGLPMGQPGTGDSLPESAASSTTSL